VHSSQRLHASVARLDEGVTRPCSHVAKDEITLDGLRMCHFNTAAEIAARIVADRIRGVKNQHRFKFL
jgi:hypothetical protein